MLFYNIYNLRMNLFRAIKLSHACLITLMLLAQSAVAQHSADHAWHDASEYCQVFTSAEASKALSSLAISLDIANFPQALNQPVSSPLIILRSENVYARGPPRTS